MPDTFSNPIDLPEQGSSPSSPGSGYHKIYPKSDGKLYSKNSAGTEYDLTLGGGGGLTWIAKTTTYTAVANDGILANTSGGAFTVTLPITPSVGDIVGFTDANGTFHTNYLTIGRNGSLIQGLAENLVVDVKNSSFQLIYSGATTGWKLDTFLLNNTGTGLTVGREITDTDNLVAGDANKWLTFNAATAKTITVPSATFTAGDVIYIRQKGVGTLSFAQGGGMTLVGELTSDGQHKVISIFFETSSLGVVIGGIT